MESRPGLYPGLDIATSSLPRYQLHQIEQYAAEERHEFEQYVKIIQFAEAVRYGTHPRVRIFLPRHVPRVYPLSPKARKVPKAHRHPKTPSLPKDGSAQPVAVETMNNLSTTPDVKPDMMETEEVDMINSSSSIPEKKTRSSRRRSRRKNGKRGQSIMSTEGQPGPIFLNDPGMDYYRLLGLESSASIEEIHKAHGELKKTHDPESDEGKLKWQGKDPAVLRDLNHIWSNIQCAFFVLSNAHSKVSYDAGREHYLRVVRCRLENKVDEATAQIQLRFAAVRDAYVRSLGVPHPDDTAETYNEDFFERATAGMKVEESDINFATNYYESLIHAFKSTLWNGVIGRDTFGKLLRDMGYIYVSRLRHAKDENALDKLRCEWNEKLVACMILKDETLRAKYNEHNRSHRMYEDLQKRYDAHELQKVQDQPMENHEFR
ncbi:hypothetical protein DSL72_008572 [Monilinia vaccinii-corymbosi]|uniref:J domain-containing protein n=1 Tax=Monilinia vaccinii-corymbosi TaxID=61207 RepID=A0A8A3PRG5_9HELO|nr:hypothetical protein DSL72_008572 [Monilinia vaccinii-corymbosi]